MQSGKFKFEKLQVWQLSMDFGENIYQISATFPVIEKYNLQTQINRAVDSIALNLAEGCTRNSNAEFSKFIGYSLRSVSEVVTCMIKAFAENIFRKKFLISIMKKHLY